MFWVLLFAFFSILISLISKKRLKESRTSEKTKAVLVNAAQYLKEYHSDIVESFVNSGSSKISKIYLTDKYFQVKFGGSEREWDGVTLSAVIDSSEPGETQARVFLDDQRFLINGNVLILTDPEENYKDGELTLEYDAKKINKKSELFTDDLILIRGKKDEIIAAFLFLIVKKQYDEKRADLENIHIADFINLTERKDQNVG